MDAIAKLKEHKAIIDEKLEAYIEKKKGHALEINAYANEMMGILKEFNLRGGKRLRPAFVVEGYRCVGGTDMDSIYYASLASEIMEGYLLVHDDVMDLDDVRRGGKSVHCTYREYHKKNFSGEGAQHFGESMAIIGGDVLETLGIDVLATSNFPDALKVKAMQKYATIVRYTGYGQLLDVLSEELPIDRVTEDHVLTIHKMKTSMYTIEGPLQMGAMLAGAGDAELKMFSDYGVPLGQAFQLQDDMLGLFGKEEKLGKPVDSDLKEGKRTILILKALESANDNERKDVMSALGNESVTPEQVEIVRDIVRSTGSYDYSKQLAAKLAEQARVAVAESTFVDEGKGYLLGIADFLINREV